MRRSIYILLFIFLAINSYSQVSLHWPESANEIITSQNATIGIQNESYINITLEGYDFIPSNARIGVFYLNDNNQYSCGGYTLWDNTQSNTLAAWGNDWTTSSTDGFVSGQPYVWFLSIDNGEGPLDGWTDYIAENIVMASEDSDGNIWTEVPYLAQNTVFTEIPLILVCCSSV